MTIDQQLRDRFDRETGAGVPEPDLAAAIAAGRRRRRGRVAAYAVGSLAVAAVAAAAVAAAAVVAPRLGADPVPPDAAADAPPADDGTFVPGTTIDTDLAAAVAAADPSLPAPTQVFASDWSRDTPLPGDQFANATEWQLVYELSAGVELLVYVSKPIPGEASVTSCAARGDRIVHLQDGTQTVDVPSHSCVEADTASGSLVTVHDSIGEPVREFWYHSMLTAPDGRFVNVIEEVAAGDPDRAIERRVLTDDQLRTVALAGGLDFPDPVEPPPAP